MVVGIYLLPAWWGVVGTTKEGVGHCSFITAAKDAVGVLVDVDTIS